jgi:hypothetical protein
MCGEGELGVGGNESGEKIFGRRLPPAIGNG